jgi:hypothetical protein
VSVAADFPYTDRQRRWWFATHRDASFEGQDAKVEQDAQQRKAAAARLSAEADEFSGRVYHGSAKEFSEFDQAKIGSTTDDGWLGAGLYFSTDPNVVRKGEIKYDVDVALHRPLRLTARSWSVNKRELVTTTLGIAKDASGKEIAAALKAKGFDGVILDYSPIGYMHQEVMVANAKAAVIRNRTKK